MTEPTETIDGSMRIVKILCFGFAAFTVVVTIVFFGWWAMKDMLVFGGAEFDRVRWATAAPTAEERCYRGDMAHHLKQEVLARGMTRTATMMLLGRPDWEDANQTEYDLGHCLWDTHGLRLYFNDDDLLVYTRIVQH
ncbi:MAG TPA: hypothetical protein VFF74_10635 [Methylophilaceae bacterium]|nr:hypothetical protein [Methylophilaceae bacterium]